MCRFSVVLHWLICAKLKKATLDAANKKGIRIECLQFLMLIKIGLIIHSWPNNAY